MRIGILTSSRADFGIYLPMLKRMRSDEFFDVNLIVFGTHLSSFYGNTANHIKELGFDIKYRIESMLLTDSQEAVSTAIGLTTIKFAAFWSAFQSEFDLVFCLGDRYEMFAAVTAGIAYNIPFAHLHGGETTLGAIDNIFRHAITLASKWHFVATDQYAKRVAEIRGSSEHIYNVGALSLAGISEMELLTQQEFKERWGIDLSLKTILMTFHPETVNSSLNAHHIMELMQVIDDTTDYQFLITMPNADTSGNLIRTILTNETENNDRVFLIENLGSQSYFSALKYCSFLLGNTSSGIIEAASFGKYVINVGNRQEGRACSENVIHTSVAKDQIISAIANIEQLGAFDGENIYYRDNCVQHLIQVLKENFGYERQEPTYC
ncbi:UDP-N-acetylglucosamine 2-epimerase [Pedobacter sp. JY14-1]|uniref:UDP-N-acetylglucosamine 2-epimerase n=1 Tax=Pedobacter sp. JY14-1 TaxID=3034151 RepID=UPI0023E13893|nr:UDP-N-acetylglucosamine 2-epimerase [Pedobacter sp. JY14-1]